MKGGSVRNLSCPEEAEMATPRLQGLSIQLITRAKQVVKNRVEDGLSGSGITPDQWNVLSYLFDHRGCPMSELAAMSSLTGPTLTRVVDQLTASALTYRNVDPADRRRVLAYLSSRGRSLVCEVRPRVLVCEAEAIAVLSSTEAQELTRLLTRIVVGGLVPSDGVDNLTGSYI